MTRSSDNVTGHQGITPDALRRHRHELRTPVNHMLGYAELLLEDVAGRDEPWTTGLGSVIAAGRAILDAIGEYIDLIGAGHDPAVAADRIRDLAIDIGATCDLLDGIAAEREDAQMTSDLAVIRGAAASLVAYIAEPVGETAPASGDEFAPIVPDRPTPDDQPGSILVVDDNQQNRDILSRRLERLGHVVLVAAGGREALDLLGERSFDVVLLDVMMPEIDGFEVLTRLRSDAATRDLPVIMLSALDEVGAAVRCIEMGADDYLTKPVDTVLLRARIGACLERKRLRDTELAYLRQAARVTGPAIIADMLVSADAGVGPGPNEADLLADIRRDTEWIDAAKGSIVFEAGDPGDSMWIVLAGRLRLDSPEDGRDRAHGEVRRGATIGELEMLTGHARATTATVVRDSRLARISRDGFLRLADAHPRLLTRATGDVIDRLRDAFQRRPDPRHVTTFVVLPAAEGVPAGELARSLGDLLAIRGSTLLIEPERLGDLLGDEAVALLDDDERHGRLAGRLNDLELRHGYVIYRADAAATAWTRRCLRQADHVLVVGTAGPPSNPKPLAAAIARHAQGARVELVMLHEPSTQRPKGTAAWLACWPVALHHHLRLGDRADLERLARRLTGTGIDIVLSGGGARGWAHAGAIQAIQAAGIPIDALGGTSMGALLGGCYVSGMSWDEVERGAAAWSSARGLFDYTLPIVSIISGGKITRMLRSVLGDAAIEDMWQGYFCVSSSLSHARPVVHRRGPMWKAVRASISLPGFLPPIQDDDQLLIDGSYLNNLPTDLVRQMYRSGTVIAVNVDQAIELPGAFEAASALSGWSVLRRRLLSRKAALPPTLAATFMRASSLSSAYTVGASMGLADLTIEPPVAQFGTLDFGAYRDIVAVGYEAASRQIEAWQQARHDGAQP